MDNIRPPVWVKTDGFFESYLVDNIGQVCTRAIEDDSKINNWYNIIFVIKGAFDWNFSGIGVQTIMTRNQKWF